jgi:hypothetical protein
LNTYVPARLVLSEVPKSTRLPALGSYAMEASARSCGLEAGDSCAQLRLGPANAPAVETPCTSPAQTAAAPARAHHCRR